MNFPPHTRNFIRPAGALSILLLFSGVHAASLEDYRERLESSRALVGQLLEYVGETEHGDVNREFETRMLAQLRGRLPETEPIEWENERIETSNHWVAAEIDAFRNERDAAKRALILTGIDERLGAMAVPIEDLENANASVRSKDEDKRKLGEILRRDEYQPPKQAEESTFQRSIREFLEWLQSVFPKPDITPPQISGSPSLTYVLLAVVGALVLGLIVFAFYKLRPSFLTRLNLKNKRGKKDRVILGERIAADASAPDLFADAERLAREGNLRGAIRKGYIAFLCELGDKKLIAPAVNKTNRDYLRAVRKYGDLYGKMLGLTNIFESHWYGLKPAEEPDWEDFREEYKGIVGGLK